MAINGFVLDAKAPAVSFPLIPMARYLSTSASLNVSNEEQRHFPTVGSITVLV
jgi:hypothetical protein